jgi:cold shock protein
MSVERGVSQGLVSERSVEGLSARGSVKWFDPVKGFGFILIESCEDAGMINRDALLHISVVRRSNIISPGEGDELIMRVDQGDRGLQVIDIEEVIQIERPIPEDIDSFVNVVVRWFNRSKGYGFVSVVGGAVDVDDVTQDIFLHVATLRRAGIEGVEEGQVLRARIETGPKGTIATAVYFS